MPDESFGKELRLRRRGEFLRVQTAGRKVGGRLFLVIVAPAAEVSARVGITVSSKVGNAVVRNRLKLWVREYLRRHKAGWPAGDTVVIARPIAATASHEAVDAELATLLGRAGRAPG